MSLTKIKSLLEKFFTCNSIDNPLKNDSLLKDDIGLHIVELSKPIEIDADKIEVAFNWVGGCGSDDLDLFALVLNENGKISQYSDFVFYNSEYRVESLSELAKCWNDIDVENYSRKFNFLRNTYPSNKEGSVVIDKGFAENIELKYSKNCESMFVDLSRLDNENISSVIFVVCNYCSEFAFKDVDRISVNLYSGRTENIMKSYTEDNFSTDDESNILYIGALTYSKEKRMWMFNQSFRLQHGSVEQLIEKFC